jgi:hypothetical protein
MAGTAAGAAKARKHVKKPGRKKGSINKFTNLKQSFLDAYAAKDGFGGDKALRKYAREQPDVFLQMIKSMLPKEVAATVDNRGPAPSITVIVSADD